MTFDERITVEQSPICVACNHREIFHGLDGESCWVRKCDCYAFMEVGAKSPWSPEISRFHNLNEKLSLKSRQLWIDRLLEHIDRELCERVKADMKNTVLKLIK